MTEPCLVHRPRPCSASFGLLISIYPLLSHKARYQRSKYVLEKAKKRYYEFGRDYLEKNSKQTRRRHVERKRKK